MSIDAERTQVSHTGRKSIRTAKTIKIAHKRAEGLADKPVNIYLCRVLNDVAWNNGN